MIVLAHRAEVGQQSHTKLAGPLVRHRAAIRGQIVEGNVIGTDQVEGREVLEQLGGLRPEVRWPMTRVEVAAGFARPWSR